MSITAYPLRWPDGWPRARGRKAGRFGKTTQRAGESWKSKADLTMEGAMERVRYELERLGVNVADDSIVSTNLKLNLAGLPRGDQGEPSDPGVEVRPRPVELGAGTSRDAAAAEQPLGPQLRPGAGRAEADHHGRREARAHNC